MAIYCPQGSGTLRQQLLMMHGIAWYCMVLQNIAWYYMVLHGIARYGTVLHLALSCTILHIRYTCNQQMSPVIAFDLAVVAKKVKVQCCYIMADMLNLKKWGGGGAAGSVVGRDGY